MPRRLIFPLVICLFLVGCGNIDRSDGAAPPSSTDPEQNGSAPFGVLSQQQKDPCVDLVSVGRSCFAVGGQTEMKVTNEYIALCVSELGELRNLNVAKRTIHDDAVHFVLAQPGQIEVLRVLYGPSPPMTDVYVEFAVGRFRTFRLASTDGPGCFNHSNETKQPG
jgi:hypothetical protein